MSLEIHNLPFSIVERISWALHVCKCHHGGSICGLDRVGVVSLRHACMLWTVTIALHFFAVSRDTVLVIPQLCRDEGFGLGLTPLFDDRLTDLGK